MISQKELKELLHYNPDTGIFTWIVPRQGTKPGAIAGTACLGYVHIMIKYVAYKAHRLAWLYVHGYFPISWIDHKNLIRSDNRLQNLRLATPSENKKNQGIYANNTSGYKGVSWDKYAQKWRAYGSLDGKRKYLGYFNAAKLASAAYQAFAKQHYGEFYRD